MRVPDMRSNFEEHACRALFVALVFVAVFLTPYIALEVSTWM